jgi:hypothetical protein
VFGGLCIYELLPTYLSSVELLFPEYCGLKLQFTAMCPFPAPHLQEHWKLHHQQLSEYQKQQHQFKRTHVITLHTEQQSNQQVLDT